MFQVAPHNFVTKRCLSALNSYEFQAVEKRARELKLSSLPERSTEVFEISSEALESKLDLILKRLETMDRKLEEINTTVSNLESKFNILEGRVEKLENDQSTTRTAVQELQDGLQEFNTQVNEAKVVREKASEFSRVLPKF